MKGYEKLGPQGRSVFARAHCNHLKALGREAREQFELANVKEIKANSKEKVIEVYFRNGELVKYKPNGDWF
ncbi:hypothetical protein ACS127_17350 [Amphibacillus sp. Q70]|uniref:hypothetical protein n=1 Tax=Amphibacillus sp. Q70 TaxID=3453416 RepID=UPI003F82CA90